MRNKVFAGLTILLLALGQIQAIPYLAPAVFAEPAATYKEIWKIVNITNTLAYNTIADVNITVNSRNGVHIASSTGITSYFNNTGGYTDWWGWLNGEGILPYHWGEMDWTVSNGSLTSITYDEIQHWGDMYFDSGGSANYTTFMHSTYMADYNLSVSYSDPDIVSQTYWQGNQIKMIDDLLIANGTTVNIVLKIVITEPGAYNFTVTATSGVEVNPSSWISGGAATIIVPDDYLTIQAAINAAVPGDTVIVSPGTYSESQILVNKSVRVIGSGAANTVIDGGNTPLSTAGLVRITADTGNVTFSGFTLKNAGAAGVGLVRVGIYAQSASSGLTYTISSNVICGTNNPDDAEDYGFYTHGGKESLVFTYNMINQTGANSILIERHTGPIDISHNTLDVGVWGCDAIFCMTYAGDNITTLQKVSNNTFDMGTGGPFDYDHRATAVTFASAFRSATLGNGTFTNIQITGNTMKNLKDHRRGISLWNGATGDGSEGNFIAPTIANNIITGEDGSVDSTAIRLIGLATNATITGNNVTNCSLGVGMNNAVGTKVTFNNIYENSDFGLQNNGTTAVSAAYNYWGDETGPAHSSNPTGSGNSVSDYVLFEPWLVKPYPPPTPISVVQVNPGLIALEAPALGRAFTVNVEIANVSMMYGFEFTLKWNSALLNLTNPSTAHKIPAVWGSNYYSNYKYNLPTGNYTLYAAARAPASPFNGSTVFASFVFKSMYDPLYPASVTCPLELAGVNIANPSATSILTLVYNGSYSCYSVKPKLLFMSKEYTAKKVPTEFDAYVNVTNIVNLYAFNFTFTFNPTLLRVITVSVPTLSGSPTVHMGWDNTIGYAHADAVGINPAANGTLVLAKITFKVEQGFVWSTLTPTVNSTLDFTVHELNTSIVAIEHDAINGTYVYTPVPGDLNMDAVVDLVDLVRVAVSFGTVPGDPSWWADADLNKDGIINIFDIILVARNYGRTNP